MISCHVSYWPRSSRPVWKNFLKWSTRKSGNQAMMAYYRRAWCSQVELLNCRASWDWQGRYWNSLHAFALRFDCMDWLTRFFYRLLQSRLVSYIGAWTLTLFSSETRG